MVDASLAHNHYDVLGQCVAVSEHASVTGPLMRRCGGVWSFRCRSGLFHSLYVCVWLCMCVCLSVCDRVGLIVCKSNKTFSVGHVTDRVKCHGDEK